MSENLTNKAINNNDVEPTRATINVEPKPFVAHNEGMITSTSDITEMIGQLFGSVFNDYVGCKIYVFTGMAPASPVGIPMLTNNIMRDMVMGNLYVDLYFEKNNAHGEGIDNLVLFNDKSESSPLLRITRVCGGPTSRVYNLNEDTKSSLLEFLPRYDKKNHKNFNPFWNDRIIEQTVNMTTFDNRVKSTLIVTGLEVDAIISKIFGVYADNDAADGEIKYDYHCMPITRSVKGVVNYNQGFLYNNTPAVNNVEYVVQIMRNNRNIIKALENAIGYSMFNSNNGGFVRYNRA